MNEIFEIEENTINNHYLSSNTANQENIHSGHYHHNDIDEIKKWIESKFHDNLNISIDEIMKAYDDNKTSFQIIINYILLFSMFVCVFLLFKTIYTLFKKQQYINKLKDINNQIFKNNNINKRKAE